MKAEYVEGIERDGRREYPGIRDLAAKYGVHETTAFRRSSAEDWPAARQHFARKLETARAEKRSEELIGKAAEFDLLCYNVAKAGVLRVGQMLAKPDRTPAEMASLGTAFDKFERGGNLALGEPTEHAKVDEKIDAEVKASVVDKEVIESAITAAMKRIEDAGLSEQACGGGS